MIYWKKIELPVIVGPVLLILISCSLKDSQHIVNSSQQYLDSLDNHLEVHFTEDNFKNKDVSQKAIYFLNRIQEDSIRQAGLFKLSYHFYKKNDSLNFRKWNKKTFDMSMKRGDTSKIAESYWDLGNFYFNRYMVDSAFYSYNKAYNLYKSVDEDFLAGKMLLNLAVIKKDIKDYTGSEISTIKAINIFKPLGENKQLYLSYNNLGVLYNELEEYDLALHYHQKALEYQENIEGEHVFKETSLNNIGVIHQYKGEYQLAEEKFQKALENKQLYDRNKRLYAMVLDNWAFAKLLDKDTSGILPVLQKSLSIRKEIDHISGLISSYIHLAEYYSEKGEQLKAKEILLKAKTMADKTNNNRDLLKTSLLLSKIDEENRAEYLQEYVYLNDSLQKKERTIRNKFARIEFETEEFIAENKYLNEQRNWILGGAGGAVFMVLLIFIIWRQKARNKELELEQEQQKTNEEIYNLLLIQQNKLEEGRHQEKERISKELHDGILGKLFGTRLMLENLFGKSDESSLENKKKYLNDLRIIEEEVRGISHELNSEFFSQKQSFIDVLEEYLTDQKSIGKFHLEFKNDDQIPWDKLNSEIKINLFRIIQEAISNIIKYAEASHVTIAFYKAKGLIQVVISDNGIGFNTNERSKGIGLKNMKSRVYSLNGQWRLTSGKKGTQIEIAIPPKS